MLTAHKNISGVFMEATTVAVQSVVCKVTVERTLGPVMPHAIQGSVCCVGTRITQSQGSVGMQSRGSVGMQSRGSVGVQSRGSVGMQSRGSVGIQYRKGTEPRVHTLHTCTQLRVGGYFNSIINTKLFSYQLTVLIICSVKNVSLCYISQLF